VRPAISPIVILTGRRNDRALLLPCSSKSMSAKYLAAKS
jgi:hypothetical protein